MKRVLATLFAALLIGVLAGCASRPDAGACAGGCRPGCPHQAGIRGLCPLHGAGCGGRCGMGGGAGGEAFNPGPPVGQVAYPYYTVRGPRDFLQRNPTPIGP